MKTYLKSLFSVTFQYQYPLNTLVNERAIQAACAWKQERERGERKWCVSVKIRCKSDVNRLLGTGPDKCDIHRTALTILWTHIRSGLICLSPRQFTLRHQPSSLCVNSAAYPSRLHSEVHACPRTHSVPHSSYALALLSSPPSKSPPSTSLPSPPSTSLPLQVGSSPLPDSDPRRSSRCVCVCVCVCVVIGMMVMMLTTITTERMELVTL